MQFLLVATLSITLASATFPISGYWWLTPSSASPSANIPLYIEITPISGDTSISNVCFGYNPGQNRCANYSTTENPDVLVNVNTSDIESTLIYNENVRAIGFQSSSSSPIYWFQGQDLIDYQSTFGAVTGTWVLAGTNQHLLCYPDIIFLAPDQETTSVGLTSMLYYINSNCSENYTDLTVSPYSTSATATVWDTFLSNLDTSVFFILVPSPQAELTVQLRSLNYTQSLAYQRPSNVRISGVWKQDWQSDHLYKSPISYIISINSTNFGVPYMFSTITDLTQNASIDSFVAQTFEGTYHDAFLIPPENSFTPGTTFTYDRSTFTLLSDQGLLLSPNGSLFNSTPFTGVWEDPQVTSNISASSQCCMPTSVIIVQTGTSQHSLTVTYILPSYLSVRSGCQSFIQDAFNSQIMSNLYIETPSISKLTWTDSLGTQLSLSGNSMNPNLVIENFNGCNFSMSEQVNPSITGTWVLVWQNGPLRACIPKNFSMNYRGPGDYYLEYSYDPQVVQNFCQNQQISPYSGLNQDSNTIWTDAFGQKLNYSTVQMAMAFSLPNTTQSFWFQLNNSISIPFESFLQTLSGAWFSPQPASLSEGCTPIDSFWIAPSSNQTVPGQVICTIASDLLNITNQLLYISDANLQTITWTDSLTTPSFSIIFSPFTPIEQMTLTLLNSNCSYSYKRANNETLISGSWKPDWQSVAASPNNFVNISTYQISINNNTYPSYMISEVTGAQSTTGNNYVIETAQGQYYDSFFNLTGATFTYDKATNSLLNTEGLLLSPNGSLFNSTAFLGNWTNPQLTDKEAPFPGGCCMPNFVSISNDGNGLYPLQITYYLPSGYSNYPGCQDFSQEIDDYQIQSTLNIATPSFVQLTWADKIGPQITFADPSSTTPKLVVSGFSTNCSFTMVFQPPSPSPPAPLSANLLSGKIVGLIIGLFMILNFW